MANAKDKMAENIRAKLLEVESDILTLEMGDERLMTNANGNLPRYNALLREARQLKELLKEQYE